MKHKERKRKKNIKPDSNERKKQRKSMMAKQTFFEKIIKIDTILRTDL